MASTGSDVLDMINATPQEQQALRYIAQMRAAGMPDAEIFASLPGFTQGGGYGYIDPTLQAASITSSYNLGRGNLALNAGDQYYQQTNNPYNVVGALQYMRDTGASSVLSDPTLGTVQASPAAVYQNYLRSLFGGPAAGGGSAAPGGAAVTPGQSAIPQTNPVGQSWIDAWRAYHPGEPDPVAGYAVNGMNTGAQQGAARLLGGSLGNIGLENAGPYPGTNQFKYQLGQGKVPGFSSINERDFGLLSPDQQQSYFGLVGSTGRVSNPAQAYQNYLRIYGQR